jgi:hypothetical protein
VANRHQQLVDVLFAGTARPTQAPRRTTSDAPNAHDTRWSPSASPTDSPTSPPCSRTTPSWCSGAV